MGWAARANKLALAPGKDRDSVGMARLELAAKKLTTPRKLERFLKAYHPEDRDGIRAIVKPYCEFDAKEIAEEDDQIEAFTRRAAAYGRPPAID